MAINIKNTVLYIILVISLLINLTLIFTLKKKSNDKVLLNNSSMIQNKLKDKNIQVKIEPTMFELSYMDKDTPKTDFVWHSNSHHRYFILGNIIFYDFNKDEISDIKADTNATNPKFFIRKNGEWIPCQKINIVQKSAILSNKDKYIFDKNKWILQK